jgi:hypothetical protein
VKFDAFGDAERREVLALFKPGSIDEIERALGGSVADEMSYLVWKYLANSARGEAGPKNVRNRFEVLRDATRQLRLELNNLIFEESAERDEVFFSLSTSFVRYSIPELASGLSEFEAAAAKAARNSLGNGGRPADSELYLLVDAFRAIELAKTRKKTTVTYNEKRDEYHGGPLWLMVRTAENAIAKAYGRKPKTSAALKIFLSRSEPDKTA